MKQLTLLFIAHFVVYLSCAQVTFSSLNDVFSYADKTSFVAQQGVVKDKISNTEEGISRSALLPKVNVFGAAEYSPIIGSMVVPGKLLGARDNSFQKVQFGLPYNFSGGVEVSMPLLNFEKWEQLKLVKLQSVASNLATKTQLEQLHINIAQSYYQALLYKQIIQLNDENEKVAGELIRIMNVRKKNDVLNPADYNRSQNLFLEVVNAGVDYRKLYTISLNNLKAALSINDKELVLKETMHEVEATVLSYEPSITNRAAFKEADAAVVTAKQGLVTSRKSALPKVSFYGKYVYQLQAKPGSESQQVNFDVSSLGVRVDVPIISGKYHKLQATRSEYQSQLAKLQQEQVIVSLQQEHSSWQTNYAAALSKQSQLERKVTFAADNLRIAQLSFKEGVMEFDEFNNSFRESIRTQIESLQNTADALVYKLLLTIK